MLYLVKLGELTLKSHRVRRRMLRDLVAQLRARTGARVWTDWGRVFVEGEVEPEVLTRTFGVKAVCPVVARFPFASLGELVDRAAGAARALVEGRLFAVRARRRGPEPGSQEVERALGEALLPFARGVDLEEPEVTVHVEMRDGVAYIYSDCLPGPGGLPVGAEGKVLLLLSGGFDSGVAAWLLAKRGVLPDFVYFHLGSQDQVRRVLRVARLLNERWIGVPQRLFTLDFTGVISAITERGRPSYWNLLLKVAFYRAAEHLAREGGYPALATGEALGQVSTQTLANLAALDGVVGVSVLRPLLAYDKEEIIALARRIGVADISEGLKEYCDLAAPRPATRATPERLALRWREAGLEEALDEAIRSLRVMRSPFEIPGEEDIYVRTLPADAVLVDLSRVRLGDVLAGKLHLEKGKKYVFWCPGGFKSREAALWARKRGFSAWAILGERPEEPEKP